MAPEAVGDSGDEGTFGHGSSPMCLPFGAEDGFDFGGILDSGPVDGEEELIGAVCKVACTPCGEPEDGRSTEAPMSDEQGALHGVFEGRHAGVWD